MDPIDAIKGLFLHAGATWVLWLLGALSLVSVFVMVERWLLLRGRGGDLRALAELLDKHLGAGDREGALRALQASPAVAAAIAAAGLRLGDGGPASAEFAMRSATALERRVLERGLGFLGTLGNNAPFVGLFGTVIGVIGAFEELGHATPGHGSGVGAASQVASQAVMSSIAEALVATAVGIFVALPAVAAYNALQRRISGLIAGSEVLSNLVLAYLARGRDHAPERREEAR